MNWTDLVVLIIIGSIAAAEAKRGLGPALFTVAGALLSARLALLWSGPVSGSLRLTANPGQNQAWALFLLFALLMAVVLTIIHVMHLETMISATRSMALGAICGFSRGAPSSSSIRAWGSGAPETCSEFSFRAEICTSAPTMPSCAVSRPRDAQNERLNIK